MARSDEDGLGATWDLGKRDLFHRKAKPATRQGRRASLSIHGPDRGVYKSLRGTELHAPRRRIKLDRTTRAASSRPHPNWTRRLTLDHDESEPGRWPTVGTHRSNRQLIVRGRASGLTNPCSCDQTWSNGKREI